MSNITLPRAEELDTLWDKSVNESIKAGDGFARYKYAEYVAAAEREAICKLADNLLRTSDAVTLIDAIRARGSNGTTA